MGAPSILIIRGASALPKFYQPVVDAVTKYGIDIQALHLPSVGLESREAKPGPPPTLQDDSVFIARHVASLADAGHDVTLVTHSYGGAPATESVRGLSKASRQEQGLDGGIVRIAYTTSLIPALGQPPCLTKLAERSFTEFPLEKGKLWAGRLVKHSGASCASPLTYSGYKDVPVSYLFCEGDHTIPPFIQQNGIDMIERETGKKVDITRIDSDHCPPLSHPELVIDWIVKLAETK
ncbi:alpha/beta-hydrolase [Apiospora phragmitis]|uniref:Alpha/beta-hydrolase n=1 Tax=Apiospora phragmitis TaxID=2905665 RepID=A0ABR1UL22_9PEZI